MKNFKVIIRKLFILFVSLTLVTALFSIGQQGDKDDEPGMLTLSAARAKVASLQKEMQDMKSRLLLKKKIALSKFEFRSFEFVSNFVLHASQFRIFKGASAF